MNESALISPRSHAPGERGASYWWAVEGDFVEPPNIRRGGVSGVQRVKTTAGGVFYVKRQTGHLFRSLRYPLGRPTLLREWRNLLYCKDVGIPVPELVCFDMRRDGEGWHALLVTAELANYVSLEDALRNDIWSPTLRSRVLHELCLTLIRLHSTRHRHGHLYPKEIFVCTNETAPSVALVDWELARRRLTIHDAAQADLRRLLGCLPRLGVTSEEYDRILAEYRAHGFRLRDVPSYSALPA